jgi:hypothetical protein
MHYNIIYEETEEVSILFTNVMLNLYDKYKYDEKIFPKQKKQSNLKNIVNNR